jgi:hypothetical protein
VLTKYWLLLLLLLLLQIRAQMAPLPLVRLNFTRPDGTGGSLSISPRHAVYVLPAAAPSGVGNMLDMGLGTMLTAKDITVGTRIAISLDGTDGNTRVFFAVGVTSVDTYTGDGWYNPALESPFIIADGIVTPLHSSNSARLLLDQTIQDRLVDGGTQKNVIAHICTFPLWMTHVQPVGTPGSLGQWNGAPVWPALYKLAAIIKSNNIQGKRLNVSAIHDWGMLKYRTWQNNSTIVPTSSEFWSNVEASYVQVAGNHNMTMDDGQLQPATQTACMLPDVPGQCLLNPMSVL